MSNITVSIPNELKHKMEEFRIINWSEVARESFARKVAQLKILESFTKESELTKEDALKLGSKLNKELAKKLELLEER